MRNRVSITFAVWLSACVSARAAETTMPGVEAAIEHRVVSIRDGETTRIRGAAVGSTILVPAMYAGRQFQPLWGETAVEELLRAIRNAKLDGLQPSDYHLAEIEALHDQRRESPDDVADHDVLLTDAFVQLAYHSRFGKVDPQRLDPSWNHERELRVGDPASVLLATIESGRISEFVAGLTPAQPMYRNLKEALAKYRRIAAAGGWPQVPPGPRLTPGDVDPSRGAARLAALRRRLLVSGDLPGTTKESAQAKNEAEIYAGSLVDGVKAFQARHGLDADGVVGPQTLAELNVRVERRIDQIRAALERGRWVMSDLPARYVLVNVAGFQVYFMEKGVRKWSSAVVVGAPYTMTPIFRADMKYVVLNPKWTVPASIARNEILPAMKRDPNYLARKGYQQVGNHFVQPPGPRNALGRIKLMFPNPHSVYLHDTPSKSFFARASRTFSHGCVRVQKPVELAALVLDNPAWTKATLDAAIATGKTRTIHLRRPLPVLILYWTAAVDAQGRVTFRPDVYERDVPLVQALDSPWQKPRRLPVPRTPTPTVPEPETPVADPS